MTDRALPDPAFQPLHQAHAIEQVAFTVQFGAAVDAAVFNRIDEAISGTQPPWPKRSEIRTMVVALGPLPPPPHPPAGEGVIFQRFRSDGSIEEELRVDRQSVYFRTALYTRWNEIWGAARNYMDLVVSSYSESAPVALIGLNYIDKFVLQGPPESLALQRLFQEDSPYLSHQIFQQPDLWHSHTGAFERTDNTTRRLVNVNVDCLDEPAPGGVSRRLVAIATVLNDMFNQPQFDRLQLRPEEASDFVTVHMEALHTTSKSILRQMLTADMSRRIALDE